jgi:predicted metal-dependent hydrolase
MRIEVEECRKLRRASACIRDAGVIQVKVPRHWPKALKTSVVTELVERIQKKDEKEKKLLHQASQQTRLTLSTQAELESYVRRINAETFNIPLGKVQIGNAKYNHLAQVNLRTKTMTVSKYCLNNAPADALRYLIVHELAHYFESGHGPEFWTLVARHVPDHKKQSNIMKAFHHQAVIEEDTPTAEKVASLPTAPTPVLQPSKPYSQKPAIAKTQPRKKESHPWAGFFKQLLLWD